MKPPRCQVIPLPDHQASFVIGGVERTRWHFGAQYPRPFFYPLNGPSGDSLTRMGHPGAPNHDHHRSVWFAHHKVLGIDFWGDSGSSQIQQLEWLAYEDSDDEARMAVKLGWFDGHEPTPLVLQELVVAVRPGESGGTILETQSRFTPQAESLEFQQTNFGFFAVRVARGVSEFFGGGRLTSSEGRTGEPDNFEQPARWMDYSGQPSTGGESVIEGVTYLDHPDNPGQPTRWHVREDGWMGAAPGMRAPLLVRRDQPLQLRYQLVTHGGAVDVARANTWYQDFAGSSAWSVSRSPRKHTSYEIARVSGQDGAGD